MSSVINETNDLGELLFTIGRMSGAAPKIRYNLRDSEGVYTFDGLSKRLRTHHPSRSIRCRRD